MMCSSGGKARDVEMSLSNFGTPEIQKDALLFDQETSGIV